MRKATLFKKFDDNIVQCLACAHYCKINPDKAGVCGVRKNIDGTLYLLVYGLAAAVQIDPIEKKPLYHFLPGTRIMSFGTVGCNLRCSFCQNWQMSQAPKPPSKMIYGEKYPPRSIVELAREHSCPSIAYTYNEPGIFFEYAYDTMKLAHKAGIKNVYVSNGYLSSEARKKVYGLLDAANIDLKSFDDKFYKQICGAKLAPVLETIRDLFEHEVHIELTTLVIPGKNDSDINLRKLAEFIVSIDKHIPWHISRFFPNYEMMDASATAIKTLEKAERIGREAGLTNIYIGNI